MLQGLTVMHTVMPSALALPVSEAQPPMWEQGETTTPDALSMVGPEKAILAQPHFSETSSDQGSNLDCGMTADTFT